jgi:branched-chain amino acid transport system substrate-binding protein
MRFVTGLRLVVAALVLLWGGGSFALAAGKPIKVGVLVSKTGFEALDGLELERGIEIFVKKRGGALSGHPVQLIVEDDASDSQTHLSKLRKLVDADHVDVLFGNVLSSNLEAAADYLARTEVPFLNGGGADKFTQTAPNKNVFRPISTNSQPSLAMAKWACENTKFRKVVVWGQDYTWGYESAGGFARAFKDLCGGRIVQEIYTPFSTVDYGPFLSNLKPADALYVIQFGDDGIRFFKQAHELGVYPRVPILAEGSGIETMLRELDLPSVLGIKTVFQYVSGLDNPANKEYLGAYRDAFGSEPPSAYAYVGWTSGQILEKALAAVGDDFVDPNKWRQALRNVKVDSPAGPFAFDDRQNAVYTAYINEIRDVGGKPKLVPIASYPNWTQFGPYTADQWLKMPPLLQLKGTWAQ